MDSCILGANYKMPYLLHFLLKTCCINYQNDWHEMLYLFFKVIRQSQAYGGKNPKNNAKYLKIIMKRGIPLHIGRVNGTSKFWNITTEEYFMFICPIYEIQGWIYYLLRCAHTLKLWMNYEDQKYVALYIREATYLR